MRHPTHLLPAERGLLRQRADRGTAVGELSAQITVFHRGLVQGADQRLDVGLGLGELCGVRGPQLLEPPDLLAQRAFALAQEGR